VVIPKEVEASSNGRVSVDENRMVPRSALLTLIGTQGPTGIWDSDMPTYNIHRQVKKCSLVGLGQWIAGSTETFLAIFVNEHDTIHLPRVQLLHNHPPANDTVKP